jgi:DNA topoisomerase-1
MLVGYHLSPLLWKHVKDGLSAGRCQTPALRLIYDNHREIAESPGKQSYVITGYFTNKNLPFVLNYNENDEQQVRAFLEASRDYDHVYKGHTLRTKTCAAPKPFSTSTLQQAASNELHLSPKDTMSVCQSLYEGGYITYHRTDSQGYSAEFKTKIATYIVKKYGENYLNRTEQLEIVTAHEAIRPTKIDCDTLNEDSTARENRLYQLIRRRTLESCMTAASISVLTATITAPQNHTYHYMAEQTIFAGWQASGAGTTSGAGTEKKKDYTYLQALKADLSIPYVKLKAHLQLTETKHHYTEAKLVNLLEEKGIGRPSTFSSLVDKIQVRNYVKKETLKGKTIMCTEFELAAGQLKTLQTEREFGQEKNKLVITPVGILSLEFLLKHFEPFFDYAYTKQMEDDLDLVVKGETEWQTICKKYYDELTHLSSSISERGKETIRIDAEHTYMIGKYGPVVKYTKDGEITFKTVRKDIDLNKLRQGGYTLADVLEIDKKIPDSIGDYKEKPVYIKVGKFGKYLEWNGLNKSLKHLKLKPDEITLDDVADLLIDSDNEQEQTRVLSEDASIRKGKYGHYIYYKNKKMKKPRFLTLDGFTCPNGDYMTCDLKLIKDWFVKTYQVGVSTT